MDELINKRIEEILDRMGYVLWDFSSGHGFINIYADKKEGGINVGECAGIAENLEFALKNESFLLGSHSVTVSSPGINRRLKTEEHFKWASGKKVKIITKAAVHNKNVFIGTIKEIADGNIMFFDDEKKEEAAIPVLLVKEARVNEI